MKNIIWQILIIFLNMISSNAYKFHYCYYRDKLPIYHMTSLVLGQIRLLQDLGSGMGVERCLQIKVFRLIVHVLQSKWLGHLCFRQWFVTWLVMSHYLKQCWNIVNWTIRNKFQLNFIKNSYIIIHENALKNVFCEMTTSFGLCMLMMTFNMTLHAV